MTREEFKKKLESHAVDIQQHWPHLRVVIDTIFHDPRMSVSAQNPKGSWESCLGSIEVVGDGRVIAVIEQITIKSGTPVEVFRALMQQAADICDALDFVMSHIKEKVEA